MIRLFFILMLAVSLRAQMQVPLEIGQWSNRTHPNIQWTEPLALSISPLGFVYVTDAASHSITRIDPDAGEVIIQGGEGWDSGQFEMPAAIDASNGLRLFVADQENHRIQILDKDLHFLVQISGTDEHSTGGAFQYPNDVLSSPLGDIYVIDSDRLRILRFDHTYRPVSSFGDRNAGNPNLQNPTRMFWLPDNRLGVCDSGLGTLEVYSAFGDRLAQWGRSVLTSPVAAAIWEGRVVFVLDASQKAIVQFTRKGQLHAVWDETFFPEGVLQGAVDIDIVHQRLYLLNRRTATLHAFKIHQAGQ